MTATNLYLRRAFDPRQPVPCETNPQLFEPHNIDHPNTRQAKNLCHNCPAHTECRTWAVQHELDNEMLMGGLTQRERVEVFYGREPKQPPQPRDPNAPWRCPKNHSPANYYLRGDRGGMRCRTCKRATDRDRQQRRRQKKPAQPTHSYVCCRNHPAENYRTRRDGRQYCVECVSVAGHQRRLRRRLERAMLRDHIQQNDPTQALTERQAQQHSDHIVGLTQPGGCNNGHKPDRRYQRPNGDWRCHDCDAQYNQRRRQKKKAA